MRICNYNANIHITPLVVKSGLLPVLPSLKSIRNWKSSLNTRVKPRKTLSRDLNAVAGMGLIEQSGRKVRSGKRVILAFLPSRAGSKK